MFKSVFTLVKTSAITLREDVIQKQFDYMKYRCLAGGRTERGWAVKLIPAHITPYTPTDVHRYKANFVLACVPRRKRTEESLSRELNRIVQVLIRAGRSRGWVPEVPAEVEEAVPSSVAPSPVSTGYAALTLLANWMEWFKDLYDREDQLIQIMACIKEAIDTDFENRFNIILYGPPGSGKTDICRTLRRNLPSDAWMEFDATNTTAAGAIEQLRTREVMPRILFLEELEKANPQDKKWLLSVADLRAEIKKVVFRRNVQLETKFLCIMTVNDISAMREEMGTALQSRFPYQIQCPHPSEATMRRILSRQIKRRRDFNEADLRWIEPVIRFAATHGVTDPRRLEAWCLGGKDEILVGDYLNRVRRTQFA